MAPIDIPETSVLNQHTLHNDPEIGRIQPCLVAHMVIVKTSVYFMLNTVIYLTIPVLKVLVICHLASF